MRFNAARSQLAHLLPFAVVGLLVGCVAALEWRYASPRSVINANPPPLPDSVIASKSPYYMTILDGNLNYYSGPAWFPVFFAIPLLGLVIGVVLGTGCLWLARYTAFKDWRLPGVFILSIAGGAGVGLIGAAWARAFPPRIFYFLDTASPPLNINELVVNGQINVVGAPFYVDMQPLYPMFAVTAAGASLLLTFTFVLLSRRRGTPPPPTRRPAGSPT